MVNSLRRPDGRIAYDDTGGGPLVVAVPGMGDVRALYRFLTPALSAAGYRVVTMDLRGHGESSVDWPDYSAVGVGSDIVALIRHLDAGPAVVIGESMAAAAAVWAAAEAPADVAGLVLSGPFVRDFPATVVQRLAIRLLGLFPSAWIAYYRRLYPTRQPADLAAYLSALRANLREPGRMAALRAMLAAPKAGAEARIGDVTAPTLVVMGTRDPDFPDPAAEAAEVARRLPGRTLMVEGAGHYPQAEMPELVVPELLDFLAHVATSRA